MIFSYDALGRPFAVKYSKNNGTKFTNYFYALNQQGDVVKIFRPVAVKDADGNVTGYTEKTYATYTYDAWGRLIGILDSGGNNLINKQTTSTALANLNPLRYRGYYYDTETGFYYLQSRYYDPANYRFINADSYASTGQDIIGTNMFAYCGNNPTMGYDPTGTWNWGGFLTGLAVAVMGVAMVAVSVATCGAATPLAAAAFSTTATAIVGLGATATGTTLAYAAATDQAIAVDVSVSVPSCAGEYQKAGVTAVIDFGNNYSALYTHYGRGTGYSAGVTYSTGIVKDAPSPESYEGPFYDCSAGCLFGIDYCQAPGINRKYLAAKAMCLTIGAGISYGTGYDEYKLIVSSR